MFKDLKLYNKNFDHLNDSGKILITTINAYCYNIAQTDRLYSKALKESNILLPDGISIVLALRLLTGKKINKIAGEDLFNFELKRLNNIKGTCFFLGSSEETLMLIKQRAHLDYPNVEVFCYPPPYRTVFNKEETEMMLQAINKVNPDVLFIGMTAPKQEKWAYSNFKDINTQHICCIGAVFDFYAGTLKRAPKWIIKKGFEWLYRLIKEPRRMWRRYLIGNTKFVYYVLRELIWKK